MVQSWLCREHDYHTHLSGFRLCLSCLVLEQHWGWTSSLQIVGLARCPWREIFFSNERLYAYLVDVQARLTLDATDLGRICTYKSSLQGALFFMVCSTSPIIGFSICNLASCNFFDSGQKSLTLTFDFRLTMERSNSSAEFEHRLIMVYSGLIPEVYSFFHWFPQCLFDDVNSIPAKWFISSVPIWWC